MKVQARCNPGIYTVWLLSHLLVHTLSTEGTEEADGNIWGRPIITLVNGGYEGIVVAIHESVAQEENENLINQITEVMTTASRHLYDATEGRAGKFFRKVSILIPPSWNTSTYMNSSRVELATDRESYYRSHIRIRDTESSSFLIDPGVQAEPFVLQPGECGEESVFIGVDPTSFHNTSSWGNPARVLVHLWGHFRWGLFDEYHHSPFNCSGDKPEDKQTLSRCTNAIGNEYFLVEENEGITSVHNITLEKICPSGSYHQKVNTTLEENIRGSIMSVGGHEQIDEFCSNDQNRTSSFHNRNAVNRQNQMCGGKSSWEVMEQHLDFSSNEKYDFVLPKFTLMVMKIRRTLVLTKDLEYVKIFCPILADDECYFLQSLALRESTGRIGLLISQTLYVTMDADFKTDDEQVLEDPDIEISEIIVLESVPDHLVKRILNSPLEQEVEKYTFLGSDVRNVSQCQTNRTLCNYSTLSEYLGNIHYDDVETFVRVFSEKGKISEATERVNLTFVLDSGLQENFPTLRLRWDKGNVSVAGLHNISSYMDWEEKLIEIRFENSSAESVESVSIKFEGSRKEMVNYELEVFLKPTYPPVTVQPFLKTSTNSDEVSSVTIYASVMKQDKPILRAKVWATICFPEGSCIEEPLQDSVDSEDVEDGIYSTVFENFSGSGNYSIAVKAKTEIGKTKWNKKGLQPSGILPNVIDTETLFEKPAPLDELFQRSPREIILQVNRKAPSYGANKLLEFSDVTPTSINLSWPAWNQSTDVGSGPISGYQIQIREAGETEFQPISVGMSLFYLFENLTEDTEYEFRVVIFRDHATHGEGPPSRIQSQRTLPKRETFVPPTGPCSGRKKWICITAPVCAIPLLVLIICLMKELLCLFRRLTYRLDQREKQVLGSRTSQDARRYRIDDMAMHNNAFNRV